MRRYPELLRPTSTWSSGWSPLEVTFFDAVKSFDVNIAIADNFVLNTKNSIERKGATRIKFSKFQSWIH